MKYYRFFTIFFTVFLNNHVLTLNIIHVKLRLFGLPVYVYKTL